MLPGTLNRNLFLSFNHHEHCHETLEILVGLLYVLRSLYSRPQVNLYIFYKGLVINDLSSFFFGLNSLYPSLLG